MEKKESIILYLSHYEVIKDLPDETLGKLYRTIFEYELGNKVEISNDIKVAFGFIYNQVKMDKKKYEEKCFKNKENGLKGGRPKKPNGFSENPKKANGFFQNPNDNGNDNENENDNGNVCVINNTQAHTLDTILSFAKENFSIYSVSGIEKSCKKFFEYYEDKNWEGVKNWKSKLKLWINDDIENGKIKEARQKRYL